MLTMKDGNSYWTDPADNSETELTNEEKVIDIYATWGEVQNVRYVSDSRRTVNNITYLAPGDVRAINGGTVYTNIVLCYDRFAGGNSSDHPVILNTLMDRIRNSATIRTDPTSLSNGRIACLAQSNSYYEFTKDVIIDCIGLDLSNISSNSEDPNHGHGMYGLFANGYTLVMGTGIMSFISSSWNSNTETPYYGFTQLSGGSAQNTINYTSRNHSVIPYGDSACNDICTMLIVHSGTWSSIIGGGDHGKITGSTYTVVKNATITDTFAGASSNGTSSDRDGTISGSTHSYLINTKMPGDSYEMNKMGLASMIPKKITRTSTTIPAWPFSLESSNESERIYLRESTVLTGGGAGTINSSVVSRTSGGNTVGGNTFVYISGESVVWDAQAAGRSSRSPIDETGNIELSGKGTVCHVLCGALTDGVESELSTSASPTRTSP